MIAIIDYGMGNLRSVEKGFQKSGAKKVKITNKAKDIESSDGFVLPGVGAFKDAAQGLEKLGLVEVIKDQISSGKPFFGICLGLQLLFDESEEGGSPKGFGIIPGKVKRFKFSDRSVKVPHMGWNQLKVEKKSKVLADGSDSAYFYFVHSYYVDPADKGVVSTVTDYSGFEFCSAVWKDNIFATQFHPEKSQKVGLELLKNFAEMVKR